MAALWASLSRAYLPSYGKQDDGKQAGLGCPSASRCAPCSFVGAACRQVRAATGLCGLSTHFVDCGAPCSARPGCIRAKPARACWAPACCDPDPPLPAWLSLRSRIRTSPCAWSPRAPPKSGLRGRAAAESRKALRTTSWCVCFRGKAATVALDDARLPTRACTRACSRLDFGLGSWQPRQ